MKLIYVFEAAHAREVAEKARHAFDQAAREYEQAVREHEVVKRELEVINAVVALCTAHVLLGRVGQGSASDIRKRAPLRGHPLEVTVAMEARHLGRWRRHSRCRSVRLRRQGDGCLLSLTLCGSCATTYIMRHAVVKSKSRKLRLRLRIHSPRPR